MVDDQNNKIKINFNKNIQAHKGRINAIEIDQRLELIITCGNDNYVQIRKLYNFELLTPIQINKKYIARMAKVSNNNFLYIMCFNRKEKISVIFGYTLTGIKFAKSQNEYYCNFDFTKSGNIVTYNYEKIIILNAYNLKTKLINEEDPEFIELLEVNKKVKGADWVEFNYYSKRNNYNVIVYIKNSIKKVKEKIVEENKIFYHDFKGNKIFE
jgi:WD40 repeat protein